MRDVHGRAAHPLVQQLQLRSHLHAQLGVEVRERLVEEEHVRLAHERPGEGDALPLTTGELVRPAREQLLAADDRRGLAHPRRGVSLGHVADEQPEADVLGHVEVREERVALEDHRHVPAAGAQLGDVASADQDPAGRRLLEPGDEAQQRRLPAARRPQDDEELAVAHLQVEALEGCDRAVALAEGFDPEAAQGPSPRAKIGLVASSSSSATSRAVRPR